jgi:uncharacterized protein involved in exopolysaccharide biosynthesis
MTIPMRAFQVVVRQLQFHFLSPIRSLPKRSRSPARGLLSRVAGRWWQMLLLWLAVIAPTAFLIYLFVKPTYIATSLLRIEPSHPEVYGPLKNNDAEVRNVNFLQTQVSLITSEKVLNPAVADALVRDQPTIKKSDDPKSDLRKNLFVEIIPETNLIRVKKAFAQQFVKIKVERAAEVEEFETTYLSHQINSLMTWENQVRKNLEQLKFEADQDKYRVVLVDPASAPKTPSNNNRLKYMAAAPIIEFLLIVGLFLVREINAEPRRF